MRVRPTADADPGDRYRCGFSVASLGLGDRDLVVAKIIPMLYPLSQRATRARVSEANGRSKDDGISLELDLSASAGTLPE